MHDRPETTVQEVLDYICQNPGRGQALPVTLRSLPHAPDGQWGNVKVSPRAVGPVGRASRVRPPSGPAEGPVRARAMASRHGPPPWATSGSFPGWTSRM